MLVASVGRVVALLCVVCGGVLGVCGALCCALCGVVGSGCGGAAVWCAGVCVVYFVRCVCLHLRLVVCAPQRDVCVLWRAVVSAV